MGRDIKRLWRRLARDARYVCSLEFNKLLCSSVLLRQCEKRPQIGGTLLKLVFHILDKPYLTEGFAIYRDPEISDLHDETDLGRCLRFHRRFDPNSIHSDPYKIQSQLDYVPLSQAEGQDSPHNES